MSGPDWIDLDDDQDEDALIEAHREGAALGCDLDLFDHPAQLPRLGDWTTRGCDQ